MNHISDSEPSLIPGVRYFQSDFRPDSRGNFCKVYGERDFDSKIPFTQKEMFVSFSKLGVVRGLHLMIGPKLNWRFISVLSGRVFDVLLDLRPGIFEASFDSSHQKISFPRPIFDENVNRLQSKFLSEDGVSSVLIPPGIAHGFQALTNSQMLYISSETYASDYDFAINPKSKHFGWPMPITEISKRDVDAPPLKEFK